MNTLLYFYDDRTISSARKERDHMVAELGSKVVHAPSRLLRWGIDDFKRYRRPAS